MKKLLMASLIFVSSSSFATCTEALPTDDANFCSSFKKAAVCYCTSSGLPAGMCQDMNALYKRMISIFGTLQQACEYQHNTSAQECIDDWNCYRQGGFDSMGRKCSSTGRAC